MTDGHLVPFALWVVPVGEFGGVARHVLDVATAGLPGYRLVVTAPEGLLLERLRERDVPVLPLQVEGVPVHRVVAQLRRSIRRLSPAVVHSHLAKADFLVAMATVGRDVATISTEHHIQADQRVFHGSTTRTRGRHIAHHARIRRFDQLIAVSESTQALMQQHWHPSAPITVIPNGIDPIGHEPRTPGLRVLSLTRLAPEKNLATTLRVFAAVHGQHPRARLTLAGEGPERERLIRLAADLDIAGAVDFPGFVDPATVLADHDVVLQPSLADNFSYTLLDAVVHGLGVVAGPVGGNCELLPEHCLVDVDDITGQAAAVVQQGTSIERRPLLPARVPTVATMTARIVGVYADAAPPPYDNTPVQRPVSDARPAVSVVSAYFRNGATLPAQLDALAAQRDAPPFEVVIADNEDSVRLAMLVAEYRDRLDVRVVPAHTVRGQCHARNVGVEASRGAIVAMSDADDVVAPTWVAAMHRTASADDVLATGPLRLDVINPTVVWRAKAHLDGLAEAPRPYLQGPFGYLGYERFVHGSNLGVRRSTYRALGGMNESMRGGSEDVDFTWRAIESGLSIAVDQDALVDYRLRVEPAQAMAQAYRYQRAQLGLWSRSRDMGRPVRGMSLRWAVRETARLPVLWWQGGNTDAITRYCAASRTGGVVGNLAGQLATRGPWAR